MMLMASPHKVEKDCKPFFFPAIIFFLTKVAGKKHELTQYVQWDCIELIQLQQLFKKDIIKSIFTSSNTLNSNLVRIPILLFTAALNIYAIRNNLPGNSLFHIVLERRDIFKRTHY